MRLSRFPSVVVAGSVILATASTGWSQIAGGPQGFGGQGMGAGQGFGGQGFGGQGMGAGQGMMGGQGMPNFSPGTGASPMNGGMNYQQQQMAQIYMLYGMLGGMGRGNVRSGVANPFANGGFGPGGSFPYLDSQHQADNSPSVRGSAAARKAELRAQRAEEKRQAKLAKAKPAAGKANKKKALDAQ